jgi:hypothetical protein
VVSRRWVLTAAITLAAASTAQPASARDPGSRSSGGSTIDSTQLSGAASFKQLNFGTGITECPTAGLPGDKNPMPLDRREIDGVEAISGVGDDRRVNQDFSCFPHNETSIAVNPTNRANVVAGANDYRLGWGTSGFYASTDGGDHWYDGIIPFPSLPTGDNLDGGGDPAVVFDRDGVVYYADINFNRTDDTSGIFVSRSTNGGFTWSRPCVPIPGTLPNDDVATCGPPGDPRQPGDGTVNFTQDNDFLVNGSVPFNDKEYIAAGPRPAGVDPVCFNPETRTPTECDAAVVGADRVYVTWTLFETLAFNIWFSYSDDQGRSWSPPKPISGSAPFCAFGTLPNACDANQFSVPTVHPTTGGLYVAFTNFNTPDENQYLLVRSSDGGQTFQGPFFITPIFDQNYPRSGSTRPDCGARGQQNGRQVLTNSCFRLNSAGNVVVDKRGGAFANDLYLVMSDNRNGTRESSNTDVFFFRSTDGGTTWLGPTRVNDDPSDLGGVSRDCAVGAPGCLGDFGNDQWFPWVDISPTGHVNIQWHDRRLDEASTESEWPTSRTRAGNYLAWYWGATCQVTTGSNIGARQCVAKEAQVITQPTAPINPGPDPVPGQGQTTFPWKNFTISDVPHNLDYTFRAGIFMGDYNNVAIDSANTAYAFWTDSRNGRSSKDQFGRNPACEQADVFVDTYDAAVGGSKLTPQPTDPLFLVTPCPAAAADPGAQGAARR